MKNENTLLNLKEIEKLVNGTDVLLNSLIDVLVKKGMVTDDEIARRFQERIDMDS